MSEKKYNFNEVLISKEQIAQRVKELGEEISRDYAGKELFLVGILKGSVPFLADLMRSISLDVDVEMDFMSVSSYGSATTTSGRIKILKDLDTDISGKNVLIVEDIVDSGLTLNYLKEYLNGRGAESVKIATFLDKPSGRKVELESDYVGFQVGNQFIVGYGLDIAQKYRNLPFISWIKED